MEKFVKYIRDHNEKILEIIVCVALYKVDHIIGALYTCVLVTGIFSQKLLRHFSVKKINK